MTLSISIDRCYAECSILFVLLNVILLSFNKLSVVT